jgi:hypothetical protein
LREFRVDDVYSVQPLCYNSALQLFCRKAFKCDYINIGYEKLTDEALVYCAGLPLAIEVLGSFLFGKNISEWRSALDRLSEKSRGDIMGVLRLSFDGLEEIKKEIFLDITCLFNWYGMDGLKQVLDYREFGALDSDIKVLVDKSLITISPYHNFMHSFVKNPSFVKMHNLLENLGKDIVRTQGQRKWSRL